MKEIKFKFIYGIDGEEDTYFSKTFSFGEIEMTDHIAELADNPLYMDYSILKKLLFTGLKDKNGKEIYESDVIESTKYDPRTGVKESYIWLCEWDETGFIFDTIGELEIIGNIYENPELLDTIN